MLPFLNKLKHQSSGMTTILRKPDEGAPENPDAGLEAAAADLANAVHAKDIKAIAAALRSAFELLTSEPEPEATPTEGLES